MRIKQTSLLSHGQFVSIFGDTFFDVALSYWILELTESTTAVASIGSISIITRIITSFFSGTIIDSMDRKKVIILCDIIRGVSILILSLFLKIGISHFYMYVIVMIIIDIMASFFKPAINSSIVDIVEDETYDQANAKINNSGFIAELLGNLSISLFFKYCSIPFLFMLDGVSYIYSAVTEIFLKIPPKEEAIDRVSFARKLKDGYKFVLTQKNLKIFILFCCMINLFISMTNVLYLPYFKSIASLDVKGYSLSMMAFSIGMIVNSFLVERNILKITNRILWIFISTVVYSLAMCALIFNKNIITSMMIFFISGFFNSIRQIIIVSSLQENLDKDHKGITFSFYSMVLNLVKPVSYMAGGILAESINISYIIAVVFIVSVFIVFAFIRIKGFKNFISKKTQA